jgi:hypothetical protein
VKTFFCRIDISLTVHYRIKIFREIIIVLSYLGLVIDALLVSSNFTSTPSLLGTDNSSLSKSVYLKYNTKQQLEMYQEVKDVPSFHCFINLLMGSVTVG